MSFSKGRQIPLSGSVSFQPNNFSCCSDYACYARHNEVVLLSVSSGETRKMPISTKCTVHQAALVNVTSTLFLVITSSEGTQIWSVDGMELKSFLPLNTMTCGEAQGHFCRGITGTGSGYICTGTSSGSVVVINVPARGGEGISFFDNLETKRDCPISTLASSSSVLAAGNDDGDVYIFDTSAGFECTRKFMGSGFPCTSLCVKADLVIAAYSTGHIRLYRTALKEIAAEVTAHARTITGLCIHPTLYMAVSVSEDQHMHVWTLPDFTSYASAEMDLLSTCTVENKKLTGVAFINDDQIGVVAYDDDEVTIYTRT